MNLENRFFYRLIKVNYFFWLIVFFIGIIIYLIAEIPSGTIPYYEKSYIRCNGTNNKIYSLKGCNLSYRYSKTYFDDYEISKEAKILCEGSPKNLLSRNQDNFTLEVAYKPRQWGNYISNLPWLFLIFIIYYGVTNILRETLIYLAFGRPFTWDRLLKFLSYIKSK